MKNNRIGRHKLNEVRSITKIAKELASVTSQMKELAEEFYNKPEAERVEEIKSELRELTPKKKALIEELDNSVAGKDRNIELVIQEKSDEELFHNFILEGIKSNIKKKWASTDTMMDDLREFILDAKDAGGEDLVRDIHNALRMMTNYAEGELKESNLYEGNAFLGARAKAIEEDLEEFEFNGKIYPVIKSKVNENKIDVALNKMEEWLPEDEEAMERYYEILNQEGWKEMEEFFIEHGNEDTLQGYGLKQRDMKKLAKAAMESTVHSGDKVNEGELQDEVEEWVRELDRNGYSRFADDYDVDPDDASEMMNFLMGLSNSEAKKILKDLDKGLYESKVTEARNIQTKRKYTDNHPAKTVGSSARIRNKILETIKDGKITQNEFNTLVKELSSDRKRWMKRNGKMFNVSEEGISLSKFGKKILSGITVNESFALFIKNK